MNKAAKRFTASQLNAITKPGLHHDGDGLYLQVSKTGSRSWVFRYTHKGRARTMGLGPYPLVGLAVAREKLRESRTLILAGMDPIKQRRAQDAALGLETCTLVSFKEAAEKCIAVKAQEWTSAKHAAQWRRTLSKFAYPIVGAKSVAEINTDDIKRILQPIWAKTPETANRVRGRIESVLTWATVEGHRQGENPARWRGHLDHSFPRRSKISPVQHFPALPYSELPAFMAELRTRQGTTALALEFAILTVARSGEVRGAEWNEFDLDAKVWTVPACRMKARREHRVPLTDRAVEILNHLKTGATNELVFPNPSGSMLSTNAFLTLLKRMGRANITAHGFRASFKTWATERGAYRTELIEASMAHSLQGLEAAYLRSDLIEPRRRLLTAWANHADLDPNEEKNIVSPIGASRVA